MTAKGLASQHFWPAPKPMRSEGATAIKAYPVALDSPNYRFSLSLPSFGVFGYVPVSTMGTRRHLVRKPLGP